MNTSTDPWPLLRVLPHTNSPHWVTTHTQANSYHEKYLVTSSSLGMKKNQLCCVQLEHCTNHCSQQREGLCSAGRLRQQAPSDSVSCTIHGRHSWTWRIFRNFINLQYIKIGIIPAKAFAVAENSQDPWGDSQSLTKAGAIGLGAPRGDWQHCLSFLLLVEVWYYSIRVACKFWAKLSACLIIQV